MARLAGPCFNVNLKVPPSKRPKSLLSIYDNDFVIETQYHICEMKTIKESHAVSWLRKLEETTAPQTSAMLLTLPHLCPKLSSHLSHQATSRVKKYHQ